MACSASKMELPNKYFVDGVHHFLGHKNQKNIFFFIQARLISGNSEDWCVCATSSSLFVVSIALQGD